MTAIVFAKRITAALLVIAWTGISLAQEPSFPQMPPGFRIGMEIELTPTAFSKIADYFDFDALQKNKGGITHLPDDFFDDYLQNYPAGLSELPEDLRKSLTQGLQLESTVIHEAQPLVGSDGKAIDRGAGLILSDGTLRRPPDKPPEKIGGTAPALPDTFEQRGELIVPKHLARQTASQLDWQTLYNRWKALGPEVKRSLVQWENLSPNKKAQLALFTNGSITTKKNLPREVDQLFKRFYWDLDGKALEFRHSEDLHVSDPAEFYRDVASLAKRAGVDRKILHPEDDRIKVSEDYYHSAGLHYHISMDKDLTEQGIALNRLELIRRIHSGNLTDLTSTDQYTYEPSARGKGLVRIVNRNRLEFRAHSQSLEDELNFNLKVLSMEKEDALKTIGSEIRSMMNDYVVDKIAEKRPWYLQGLEEYMTPEQRLRVAGLLDEMSYARRLRNGAVPVDFWERAPSFLEGGSNIASATSGVLSDRDWPEEFWEKVPGLLKRENLWVISALESESDWPEEVRKIFPKLLTSSNPKVQAEALRSLAPQSAWSREIWDSIPSLMRSTDHDVQMAVKNALVRSKSFPDAIWPHVLEQLKSDSFVKQRTALEIMASKSKWPKEVWDEIPAALAHSDSYVQAEALRTISGQPSWPKGVSEQVHEMLNSSNSLIRSRAKSVIEDRDEVARERQLRPRDDVENRSPAQAVEVAPRTGCARAIIARLWGLLGRG